MQNVRNVLLLVAQAACIQFYKRFIECPNFMAWFERRRGAAAAWQVKHYRSTCLACMQVVVVELIAAMLAQLRPGVHVNRR